MIRLNWQSPIRVNFHVFPPSPWLPDLVVGISFQKMVWIYVHFEKLMNVRAL